MKVRVLPLQPHCFAFGGFEIQMLSVIEAVRACGVDAQPMNVWSRDADFDTLHVWGLDVAHMAVVYWARRSGKRVVMTALLPYLTTERRLRHLASLVIGQARIHRKLLAMLDILVVVNDAQKETACRMLGMQRDRVEVIPNIVEARFFEQIPAGQRAPPHDDGYVLCTGNICPRKNQVNLAKACLAAGQALLIIGDVLTGEERYAEALGRLVEGQNAVRWIRGMPAGSPDLVLAYHRCAAFALPSHNETQPISLLEAAAAGKPLLIGDRPYAEQKYFQHARRVAPESDKSIEQGLRAVLAEPRRYIAPREFLQECRKECVGQAYERVFTTTRHIPT